MCFADKSQMVNFSRFRRSQPQRKLSHWVLNNQMCFLRVKVNHRGFRAGWWKMYRSLSSRETRWGIPGNKSGCKQVLVRAFHGACVIRDQRLRTWLQTTSSWGDHQSHGEEMRLGWAWGADRDVLELRDRRLELESCRRMEQSGSLGYFSCCMIKSMRFSLECGSQKRENSMTDKSKISSLGDQWDSSVAGQKFRSYPKVLPTSGQWRKTTLITELAEMKFLMRTFWEDFTFSLYFSNPGVTRDPASLVA